MPISSKSLTPPEQKRVRDGLAKLNGRYTNQTATARALVVKQQTVSRVLDGGTVGVKLAGRIARALGLSYEDLIGGKPSRRSYAELAGWPDAAKEAAERKSAPASAIEAVSRQPAWIEPIAVEWSFVADVANLWQKWAPKDERTAEETADAGREATALVPVEPVQSKPVKRRRPRGRKPS